MWYQRWSHANAHTYSYIQGTWRNREWGDEKVPKLNNTDMPLATLLWIQVAAFYNALICHPLHPQVLINYFSTDIQLRKMNKLNEYLWLRRHTLHPLDILSAPGFIWMLRTQEVLISPLANPFPQGNSSDWSVSFSVMITAIWKLICNNNRQRVPQK